MKLPATILAFSMFATAPFQCAHDSDEVERGHDTPSQALWELSEQFKANGETQARTETLRRLVDRYPTSEEAERAREALGTTTASAPATTSGGTAGTTSGTGTTTPATN